MRMSDWSSDVCSSDLPLLYRDVVGQDLVEAGRHRVEVHRHRRRLRDAAAMRVEHRDRVVEDLADHGAAAGSPNRDAHPPGRRDQAVPDDLYLDWIPVVLGSATMPGRPSGRGTESVKMAG